MSGHSKWSTIKRKKGANDAARAKVFTKLSREIAVAVKEGGGDPNNNSKLRDLLAKGRAANVPQDNLLRAIKKAGDDDKTNYESNVYEGYGCGGIAVIVETLTDNKNRTASNVRHYFDKFGGNLGQSGCVSFMFASKGVLDVSAVDEYGDKVVDGDKLMEDALEAGAEDFSEDGDIYEITTEPDDFDAVKTDLEKKGYTFVSAEIEKVPSTYVTLTNEDDLKHMELLLDHLEEDEDIVNVWHNWDEQ